MAYSYKNLNSAIDRWLKKMVGKAPDVNYAESFLLKELSEISDMISKPESIVHTKAFNNVYHNYKIGNYLKIEALFRENTSVINLLTNKQKRELLDDEVITFLSATNSYRINDRRLIKEAFKAYKTFIFYSEIKRKLTKNNNSSKILGKKASDEDKIWFKVGLLFASGEMDKLIKKHHSNCTKIANELKNKSYRPYIAETIHDNKESDKNIYKSSKKVMIIHSYCVSKNISMTEAFLKHIQPI